MARPAHVARSLARGLRQPQRAQLVALCAALLAVRAASMLVVAQPGYTDAYYYVLVAERVALGQGLTADFVWNFMELPQLAELPVASHRFWMPLPTLVQSAGIRLVGGIVGSFGAAQLATVAFAAAIPALAYAAGRSLGGTHRLAMLAGAFAGLGGAFAPAWVSVDSFAPAAVIGTAFFLLFRRAAAGDVRAGALAGAAVGLLYLARAEGALFGLALLALRSRAGLAGAGVALAIGIAWQLRQAALGPPADLLARSVLLLRYEDLYRIAPPSLEAYLAAWPDALRAKGEAIVANSVTFAVAFLLLLLPGIAVALRRGWQRADVRAWALLALGVFLAQSLVFTLHSTRGSYFHSLAAFLPFGVALAIVGSARWAGRPAAVAALMGVAILSVFSVLQWDLSFNSLYRQRAAALARIPDGPFLAIDGSAWRWISGRPVAVMPADGPTEALCAMTAVRAGALVIEPAHFSAYGALARGEGTDDLRVRSNEDGIVVLVPARPQICRTAQHPPS